MTGPTSDVDDFILRLVRAEEIERGNLLKGIVGSRHEPAMWQALLSQIDEASAVLARGGSGHDQEWFHRRQVCRQSLKTLLELNGLGFFKLLALGELTVEAIASDEVEHVARHYAPSISQQPVPRQQSAGTGAGHASAHAAYTEELRRQGRESRQRFNNFVREDNRLHEQRLNDIAYNRRLDDHIQNHIDYNDYSDSWNRD